jgi:DNA-binding transcriptional LysR family regulator
MMIHNHEHPFSLFFVLPKIARLDTGTVPSLTAIRLFTAAYEERSFSRAAAREHTTQPAVSQRVRALEDELGVRLLERSPSQVTPTAAGDAYYRRAIDLLATLEQAGRDAPDWREHLR